MYARMNESNLRVEIEFPRQFMDLQFLPRFLAPQARTKMSEAISVSIRVRPVPEGSRTVFSCYDDKVITQTEPDERCTPVPNATFRYDNVFDPTTTTQAVYEKVAQRIVNGVVDGINGTMFAYGQTASGKTFTMQGGGDSPGASKSRGLSMCS